MRFSLGDGEYWQIEYVKNLWKGIIVPVIKPKGEKSPNKTLKATRRIVDKYGPILYRLRGIVESFIAFIFPHDNKAEAYKKDNAGKTLKLRAIAYNILTITTYQDMFFRQYLGITLRDYIDEHMPKNPTIPINLYQHLATQVLTPAKQ